MLNTVHHTQAEVTVDGQPVTVHAVACGTVTIKRWHHSGPLPEWVPAPVRFAAVLADRRFAAPLPIWAYVVQTPDAVVVIDTGADPGYTDPTRWAGHEGARRFVHSFIRLDVTAAQTLPARLAAAGLDPADVDAVVLTHQHIDHTGTVPAFPGADVWTTAAEDRAARTIGAEQWRWRSPTTRIRHVDTEGASADLGTTVALTADGLLTAVHTPGHTPGSVTVRLATDQGDLWFTGDTSFTAAAMDPCAPTAGIHTNLKAVRRLQRRLQHGGHLFPSHDPDAGSRLQALTRTGG
jgi:glyoxylase-like metal-dependent hydrolase (beta-lactamase superfamily II)